MSEMSPRDDSGRRLYRARGADGEDAWVDHDELWKLQQIQAEDLRRRHAERRRKTLFALAGIVALLLVLALWRLAPVVGGGPAARGGGESSGEADRGMVASPATDADKAMPGEAAAEPGDAADDLEAEVSAIDDETGGATDGDSGAAGGPPTEDAVAQAIDEWADAWARQDVEVYLAGYSAAFQPSAGGTGEEWREERRRRLQAPAFIRVEIEELEIRLLEPDLVEATFRQTYLSSGYSDVVRKTLRLAAEEGGWRIVSEQATPF